MDRERLRTTFDESADIYDAARPSYPSALLHDLVQLSRLPNGARILEIGCGTGKATVPLAARGYRMLGLEPGTNLAAVARRNLAAFPRVEIEVCSFEDWKIEPAAFDLVVAATSFDWVDPAVRYQKTAAALKPGSCVALFWNAHVQLPGQDRFFEVVQEVYRRHAPEMVGSPLSPQDLPTSVDRGFLETGLFVEVAVKHYPWTESYDTDRYLNALRTFSGHIALPEDTRARLLADIAALIDSEFGGLIEKHWLSILQLTRKRAATHVQPESLGR